MPCAHAVEQLDRRGARARTRGRWRARRRSTCAVCEVAAAQHRRGCAVRQRRRVHVARVAGHSYSASPASPAGGGDRRARRAPGAGPRPSRTRRVHAVARPAGAQPLEPLGRERGDPRVEPVGREVERLPQQRSSDAGRQPLRGAWSAARTSPRRCGELVRRRGVRVVQVLAQRACRRCAGPAERAGARSCRSGRVTSHELGLEPAAALHDPVRDEDAPGRRGVLGEERVPQRRGRAAA